VLRHSQKTFSNGQVPVDDWTSADDYRAQTHECVSLSWLPLREIRVLLPLRKLDPLQDRVP